MPRYDTHKFDLVFFISMKITLKVTANELISEFSLSVLQYLGTSLVEKGHLPVIASAP